MSLIVMEHVHLSFGSQHILTDASLRIGEKERIGLVGPNGAGKSTLLELLRGELAPDSGVVRQARSLVIGHLPQDVQELAGGTVLRSVLETVPGRAEIQARLSAGEEALAVSTDLEEQLRLAELLGELAERLEHFEVYYSEQRARQILRGLGFEEWELQRPVAELSGGWKMRCALAGLLFQQPDVLFLDEPTNHLDLPSVLWLDRFLDSLRSAVLLISHDRDFLDRHVRRVVSFEPEGLRSYEGNYRDYQAQRELEEEVRQRSLENRERVIKRTERFVERFRSTATKARQAQARARRVRRMTEELEAERPQAHRRALSFSFPPVPRTGRDVLLLEDVHKAFGPRVLFSGLTRGVYQGDRIVIVGRNGAGKTTLLRMMAGDLAPDRGTVRRGAGVKLGYYAQHMSDQLDLRRTVVEEVRACSPVASESFVRGVCGAFLFSGDDVDKAVGVLSGGERARVQLARLLVDPGNVLLMDEPTNHLDVEAADALARALSGYQGTLVFVSHDLGFVHRLATRVWDLEGGELLDYPGRLDEYLAHKERQSQQEEGPKAPVRSGRTAAAASPPAAAASPPASQTRPAPARPAQKGSGPGSPDLSQSRRAAEDSGSGGKGSGAGQPGKRTSPAEPEQAPARSQAARSRQEATPRPTGPPRNSSPPGGATQPGVKVWSRAPRPVAEILPAAPAPLQGGPAGAEAASQAGTRPSRPGRSGGRRGGDAAERHRLQERIETLQAELTLLEPQLADPEVYRQPARFDPLLRRFQELTAKMGELRARSSARAPRDPS